MKLVVGVSLVVAIAGCKQQSTRELGEVASCNMPKANNCREYAKDNLALGSAHVAKLCGVAVTGTFAMVPCPTANMIGRCAQMEHTDVYYTGYPIPAKELEQACRTAGGTYTPAP